MFERTDEGYTARFTNKIDGSISVDGEDWDLEELIEDKKASRQDSVNTENGSADVYQVLVKEGDWGMFQLGNINVFFQVLVQNEVIPARGIRGRIEMALLACLSLSAMLHIIFLIWTLLGYDPDAHLERQMISDRFVEFMAEDIADPLEEEELEIPEEDTTGKKAGGEEGKFGDEDSEIPESKVPKVDGEMVDEIDVKNIGVNAALGSEILGAGPLKDIFGNQEGFDSKMNVAMSGEGGDLVIGRGAGGMGMRGVGKGGGGEGFGRIQGLGKVDTGGGKGTGGGIGKKKARKVKPKLSQGTPQIGDFCDKGNIRRVVSAKSNAIKYCFERELQQNPKLSGKISAQWKVGLDGKVMSASIASTTMNNRKVEGCIARVIQRMRFDKPDGGICIINYPFVFTGIE
ncbi:AgmX/PglI C-terminal domain-containing protein [Bradymonas sediminis]|uniref:AgmX/PglI C-terminal domain-containing protein n=1 Tax=Bradymonas sediminis TaxID=1548548 RepID=A0A2Z4FLB0_9DELT|nr:AgmX/PglI C-terminal domain-containing protein [Bradymonas sediminis]AWV89488.1 hypothetical protein DN745_09105 [Bradymonas sediminis]